MELILAQSNKDLWCGLLRSQPNKENLPEAPGGDGKEPLIRYTR